MKVRTVLHICFFVSNTSLVDLEKMLLELGAVKESDVRLKKRSDSSEDERPSKLKSSRPTVEDDDDDWD